MHNSFVVFSLLIAPSDPSLANMIRRTAEIVARSRELIDRTHELLAQSRRIMVRNERTPWQKAGISAQKSSVGKS